MEITVQELIKGKPTLIKNKEFYQTKNYVEPFIERLSAFTQDFRIQVKMPDQMTFTREATDLTYNRVLIQAVLPKEHSIDGHDEVIGFLYGLDVRKPVVKMYRGYLNSACTNLTVFNPQWINVQELVPGDPINFAPIKPLLENTSDFADKLKKLKSTHLDRDLQKEYLGHWIDYTIREKQDYGFGKVQLAVSTPIDAYKKLFVDSESQYFIPEGIDPNMYDVYNAFTQVITDDKRDILNKFEKTMLVNQILGI